MGQGGAEDTKAARARYDAALAAVQASLLQGEVVQDRVDGALRWFVAPLRRDSRLFDSREALLAFAGLGDVTDYFGTFEQWLLAHPAIPAGKWRP